MRRKRLLAAVLFSGVLAGAGVATKIARAGSVGHTEVQIFTTGGLDAAKGDLLAARQSGDPTQYIGCSRYAYDTGSNSINCTATNAAGVSKSCFSDNDAMMRAAETLNSAGYLYFVVNADGSCDRVITNSMSYNL